MKRFFLLIILASVLKLPDIGASCILSPVVELDAIERGKHIYCTLSTIWTETRKEIEKGGLNPYFIHLSEAWKREPFDGNKQPHEAIIATLLAQDKLDIKATLIAQADFNQRYYGRISLFADLNVETATPVFKLLGFYHYDATSFILNVLRNHLKDPQGLNATYCLCEIVSPSLKNFLKHDLLKSTKDIRETPYYRTAIDLLWYEPYQILPHAINARLEELFRQAHDKSSAQEPGSL